MAGEGMLGMLIPEETKRLLTDLKLTYPVLLKRLESLELQMNAISFYLAQQDAELWRDAVQYAKEKVDKENEKLLRYKAEQERKMRKR